MKAPSVSVRPLDEASGQGSGLQVFSGLMALRRQSGLTTEDLAALAGLDEVTVRRAQRGALVPPSVCAALRKAVALYETRIRRARLALRREKLGHPWPPKPWPQDDPVLRMSPRQLAWYYSSEKNAYSTAFDLRWSLALGWRTIAALLAERDAEREVPRWADIDLLAAVQNGAACVDSLGGPREVRRHQKKMGRAVRKFTGRKA